MRRATGKQTLRPLSLSYQKKDWRAEPQKKNWRVGPQKKNGGQGPINPSFGMTQTKNNVLPSQIIFCSQCHTKRRIGKEGLVGPGDPSFSMTMTKTLRSVFPWPASHIRQSEASSLYPQNKSWICQVTLLLVLNLFL